MPTITITVGQKIKKSPGQKNSWNEIIKFHEFFLTKFHFLQFQKWPKFNFWTGKKFNTAKKAISRFFIFLFFFYFTIFFYFYSCREKKDSEVQTLEQAKETETESIDSLEKENEELRDKLSKLKSHYLKLYDFAKKNNIELKPRNVPMGSVGDST